MSHSGNLRELGDPMASLTSTVSWASMQANVIVDCSELSMLEARML